jgi:5'-nucleotidase
VRILLTNDDGVDAEGLAVLRGELAGLGEVAVVAPDRDQSAISHSLTLRRPLHAVARADGCVAVDGTPTDCVLLAVHDLLGEPPDVVVSGVNHGPNLGDDVTYSGTVAAAFEGTLLGIPSLAVSLVTRSPRRGSGRFTAAARVAREIVKRVGEKGLPRGTFLNVNVPEAPEEELRGVRWTRLGQRVYRNAVTAREDEHGGRCYEIGGEPHWVEEAGTDFDAVARGYVSVTPVQRDLTDYASLPSFESWGLGAPEDASGRAPGRSA